MVKVAKDLLTKMRFVEWLSAQDLSALQLRVAIRLTSLCNMKRGFAWPSYDTLAADLGASRRHIIRAVNRLEQLGLFTIMRGGGRRQANEYRPRFDRVPHADVYAARRAKRETVAPQFSGGLPEKERVTSRAETVTSDAIKGDVCVTPSEEHSSESRFTRSATAASPDSDAAAHGPALAKFERALKAGAIPNEALPVWRDHLEEITESSDAHKGDPVGGRAYRLLAEVEDRMHDLGEWP